MNGQYRFLVVSAPFGGIEVYFRNIQSLLEKRSDMQTSYVWIDWHPGDFIARVPPLSLNWTLKAGILSRKRIRDLERAGMTFDAALFNHATAATFVHEFRQRVPIILSLDNTPILMEKYQHWYTSRRVKRGSLVQKIKYRVTQKVYEDAFRLLAWSGLVKDSLVNDYNVDADKISIIPPGIDLRQWSRGDAVAEQDAQRNRKIRVLFVGAEFKRKGGDILARVARRKEFSNCEFSFVTRGYEESTEHNITVHDELVSNSSELLSLFRRADIFVMPTRADFSPLTLCEAMAMKLPVITSDVGGINEIVDDGKSGFVVPPDDEDALVDRLRSLIADPDLRTQLGIEGRKLVESKFNLATNTEAIVQCLKSAAGRKRER